MAARRVAEPWQRRPNALVVLSGLHATLPASEVLACVPSRIAARSDRLLLVQTPFPDELRRLAYSTLVLDFLGAGSLDRLPFAAAEEVRGTYAIRVSGASTQLRQALYRLLWNELPEPRVALRDPDTELHAFVLRGRVWWGRLRHRVTDALFAGRQTQQRPFFRSYGMQPRKSRCLVNLSGVQPGQRLLDPCCGTGSCLIEAALMGIKAYGSDNDPRAVAGSRLNTDALGLDVNLRVLDARRLDGWGMTFDAIVSDLPYGLSASLAGTSIVGLYRDILRSAALVLPRGGVAVLGAPSGLLPAAPDQFVVLERHVERVHESLQREISVLCRR
ncbi:MAG TPA: methyltransferase domain-containing protein [Candidatus Dormibacteraeota bacterium]|nr:methyltransferase domain-containing protein [Candidatus Dormibacteraeota bacterium]